MIEVRILGAASHKTAVNAAVFTKDFESVKREICIRDNLGQEFVTVSVFAPDTRLAVFLDGHLPDLKAVAAFCQFGQV